MTITEKYNRIAERILARLRPDIPYSLKEDSGRTLLTDAAEAMTAEIVGDLKDVRSRLAYSIVRSREVNGPRTVNAYIRSIEESKQPPISINLDLRKDYPLAFVEEMHIDGKVIKREMRVVLRSATPVIFVLHERTIRRQAMKQVSAANITANGSMHIGHWITEAGVATYGEWAAKVQPVPPPDLNIDDLDDDDDLDNP